MENKDDLISRRAALDIVAKDSGMADTYDRIEALPGQMTAEEAWEIAIKICLEPEYEGMHHDSLEEIFGTDYPACIMRDNTPEEANAKIEAWRSMLKVGDVVEFNNGAAVVTLVSLKAKVCCVLYQNGNTCAVPIDILYKTGKTIDIQSILDQLGA